jgi:hypothetical protein
MVTGEWGQTRVPREMLEYYSDLPPYSSRLLSPFLGHYLYYPGLPCPGLGFNNVESAQKITNTRRTMFTAIKEFFTRTRRRLNWYDNELQDLNKIYRRLNDELCNLKREHEDLRAKHAGLLHSTGITSDRVKALIAVMTDEGKYQIETASGLNRESIYRSGEFDIVNTIGGDLFILKRRTSAKATGKTNKKKKRSLR